MTYLEATSHMQRHLFYVGSRESLEFVLSPLLYEVVEGLLSSVLHGQTLGAVFGRGERTETLTLG